MITFLRRSFVLLDRPARIRFGLFALISIGVAAMEAMALALMLPLTDLLLRENVGELPSAGRLVARTFELETNAQVSAVLGVLVVVLFTVKGVLSIAMVRWAVGNSLRQEAKIARRMFANYLTAPTSFHLKTNSAKIQRTLNESLVLVFRRTLPFVLGAAADLFTLCAIAAVILLNDVGVGAIAIVYFMVVGLVYQRYIGGSQKAAARSAHRESAVRYQQVQEALRATREIAVLHREDYFVEQFYQTKLDLVDAQRILIFYQLLPRYFLDLAFVLGAAIMVGYAFTVLEAAAALATVGLFLAASIRLMAPLNRVMSTFTVARTAEPHVESVISELAVLEGLQRQRTDESHGRLPPSDVELRDVSFRYEGTTSDVLQGVSLRIAAGEEIGIVGATGAGKTTLLGIILGLLDASTGEMSVGGRLVSECRTDWQLSIGYVPQEILVIDDSLRANIVFGIVSAEVDEERVERVVRAAQLEDFIASLPAGLDTSAGEAGVRLSGGQRQRLGLARALYQRPSVLVLDEATSAIDAETEARVMAAIADRDRAMTVIMVSHRLSTLQHSDRIYFLQSNGLAAVGTFDELNASEPEFAQLVALAQLSVVTPDDALGAQGFPNGGQPDERAERRGRGSRSQPVRPSTVADQHPRVAIPSDEGAGS